MRLHLLVHQRLRPRIVFDPHETIVGLPKFKFSPPHLLPQPLSPVQPHLDAEWKPGLDPCVHPPHLRMDLVLVQHVAGSLAPHHDRPPALETGLLNAALPRDLARGGLRNLLADPLDILGIIHELDVVVPETMLHGGSPHSLHFRLPLAENPTRAARPRKPAGRNRSTSPESRLRISR